MPLRSRVPRATLSDEVATRLIVRDRLCLLFDHRALEDIPDYCPPAHSLTGLTKTKSRKSCAPQKPGNGQDRWLWGQFFVRYETGYQGESGVSKLLVEATV
jgi:hypothetical protein